MKNSLISVYLFSFTKILINFDLWINLFIYIYSMLGVDTITKIAEHPNNY